MLVHCFDLDLHFGMSYLKFVSFTTVAYFPSWFHSRNTKEPLSNITCQQSQKDCPRFTLVFNLIINCIAHIISMNILTQSENTITDAPVHKILFQSYYKLRPTTFWICTSLLSCWFEQANPLSSWELERGYAQVFPPSPKPLSETSQARMPQLISSVCKPFPSPGTSLAPHGKPETYNEFPILIQSNNMILSWILYQEGWQFHI